MPLKKYEILSFEPLDFARDMLVEKIKSSLILDSPSTSSGSLE
jgi:hypothetical protein